MRHAQEATAGGAAVPIGAAPADAGARASTAGAGARDECPAGQSEARSVPDVRRSATASQVPVAPRPPPSAGYTRPAYYAWADLLRRTFAIDVLACRGCGGRLRLLATITDARVIRRILRRLGLPTEVPEPAPARQPGWWSAAEVSPASMA